MNILKKLVSAKDMGMKLFLFYGILLLALCGKMFAFASENITEDASIHLNSHVYLMNTSKKVLDQNLILTRSLRYMYSKNTPILESYSDVYSLEEVNKSFILNTIKNNDNNRFSDPVKYMAKLKDVEVFAERDIVEELNIIGEEYSKREQHINEYLGLGDFLKKSSNDDIKYLKSFSESLDGEVSELQNKRKTLFKEYELSLKNKNIKQIDIIETNIQKVSEELTPKEVKKVAYKFLLNRFSDVDSIILKRTNAVSENKDALIKNVKIKLQSGKYINIIEE